MTPLLNGGIPKALSKQYLSWFPWLVTVKFGGVQYMISLTLLTEWDSTDSIVQLGVLRWAIDGNSLVRVDW